MHGLSFPTNQLLYDIRAVTTHTHTHARLCQGVCVRLVYVYIYYTRLSVCVRLVALLHTISIHVLSYWLMEIDKRIYMAVLQGEMANLRQVHSL